MAYPGRGVPSAPGLPLHGAGQHHVSLPHSAATGASTAPSYAGAVAAAAAMHNTNGGGMTHHIGARMPAGAIAEGAGGGGAAGLSAMPHPSMFHGAVGGLHGHVLAQAQGSSLLAAQTAAAGMGMGGTAATVVASTAHTAPPTGYGGAAAHLAGAASAVGAPIDTTAGFSSMPAYGSYGMATGGLTEEQVHQIRTMQAFQAMQAQRSSMLAAGIPGPAGGIGYAMPDTGMRMGMEGMGAMPGAGSYMPGASARGMAGAAPLTTGGLVGGYAPHSAPAAPQYAYIQTPQGLMMVQVAPRATDATVHAAQSVGPAAGTAAAAMPQHASAAEAVTASRRAGRHPVSTSEFTGVHWHATRNVWKSMISSGGNMVYLGSFARKHERYAAAAFDDACMQLLRQPPNGTTVEERTSYGRHRISFTPEKLKRLNARLAAARQAALERRDMQVRRRQVYAGKPKLTVLPHTPSLLTSVASGGVPTDLGESGKSTSTEDASESATVTTGTPLEESTVLATSGTSAGGAGGDTAVGNAMPFPNRGPGAVKRVRVHSSFRRAGDSEEPAKRGRIESE